MIVVGVIVTLLSAVIMLSVFVQVSLTELGSTVEVIITEQMITPGDLNRKVLGR